MMRRGNMFLVLMLVTTVLMVGSVQAVLKGNSIVGSGENDDPYTWNIGGIKGTIGLTEEGKLRQYDGGWKHLYNPKGDGSESNPYRFSDSDARGLAYKDLTLRKRVQISFRHEDKWGFRPPYILGDGTEGNPYRAGVSGMEEFGVTRFCEVMKKTAIGSWQMITDDMNTGAREYKGNGGINNPFKISDASDKGLYCYRGHGFVWVLLMYYYNGEWYFETPSVPVVRGSATAVGGGAAGSISVMTYNIRYGCGSAYECADFEYNIESISDLINGRKPYVLVIQELGKSGVRDKVENLELIKGHTKYRGRETDGNLAVLALLGSIEATEAKGYSNDETYFFYSRTPITIGDTKYVIYNTHLRRPPFVADFDENKPNNEQLKDLSKTRQQVKELAVAVEKDMRENPDLPFIVMGDFNLDKNTEEGIEAMKPLTNLMQSTTLSFSFPVEEYCEQEDSRKKKYGCFRGELEKIDYIFFSNNLVLKKQDVVADSASDHYPLYAELEYDPSKKAVPPVPLPGGGITSSLADISGTAGLPRINTWPQGYEIDEVWAKRVGQRVWGDSKVWDVFDQVWREFSVLYPKTKGTSITPGGLEKHATHVQQASKVFGVPEAMIWAIMGPESGGKSTAVSTTGCVGVMQVCGWKRNEYYKKMRNYQGKNLVSEYGLKDDAFDAKSSVFVGAYIFKQKQNGVSSCRAGDEQIKCAIASYNAGGTINAAAKALGGGATWTQVYQKLQEESFLKAKGYPDSKSWQVKKGGRTVTQRWTDPENCFGGTFNRRVCKFKRIDGYVQKIFSRYRKFQSGESVS